MDFKGVAVLCIGDVMLDRFAHGEIERISPEAPIPVLRMTGTTEMLGGVGNVANNIAALGGTAVLVALVGNDGPGATIGRLLSGTPSLVARLVETDHRPTICKTRFIASHQQVVRTDDESQLTLQEDEESRLIDTIDAELPKAAAVILSDYGKGVLSEALLKHTIAAARARRVPVFVDPKARDFARYAGATCITPNLQELSLATGLPVRDDEAVTTAARAAMVSGSAAAVLATRSEKGMLLVQASGEVHSVAARAREVYDVSGAGDTVIATFALAHASGLSLEQAMHAANAAAGVVVSKRGTATASIQEVMRELEDQDEDAASALPDLSSLEQAAERIDHWRSQGLKVGFTNGCFDILHPGHVALLRAARQECDRLVLALNSDASVKRLKGAARPINDLQARAQVLSAIRYVDCVTSFADDTPLALIEAFKPDVLVKGGDYTVETVVGASVVQEAGGRVVLVNLVAGRSTTAIVQRVSDSVVGA